MSIQSLQHIYQEARNTSNHAVHHAFVQQLLEDTSEAALEFHYRIMHDPGNASLQQEVEKAYCERGKSGYEFLLPKLGMPIPAFNKANLLHLLGHSGNNDLLKNILPHITDPNKEVRCQAIAATGWLGNASTVCYLKRLLVTERTGHLRIAILKAVRQITQREPEAKNGLADVLYNRLTVETDEKALAATAFALQELIGMKAGLSEDERTGEISGDLRSAKDILLKNDSRFKA